MNYSRCTKQVIGSGLASVRTLAGGVRCGRHDHLMEEHRIGTIVRPIRETSRPVQWHAEDPAAGREGIGKLSESRVVLLFFSGGQTQMGEFLPEELAPRSRSPVYRHEIEPAIDLCEGGVEGEKAPGFEDVGDATDGGQGRGVAKLTLSFMLGEYHSQRVEILATLRGYSSMEQILPLGWWNKPRDNTTHLMRRPGDALSGD